MNSGKRLHIVCHTVPWPADFGGVLDLFYKLKNLHEEGVKIILHCFLYNRKEQDELNKYCEKVYYYKRKKGWNGFSFSSPYIVSSRAVPELLINLLKDDAPVLLEGIHCTAYVHQLINQGKKVFLRLHNVESVYYRHLYQYEKNIFKKIYFLNESLFLKKHEKRLPEVLPVFTVSQADADYCKENFLNESIRFLPVFIPYNNISCKEGLGDYHLYHGNLSVTENEKAATWLLQNVFSKINQPLIIAGMNPSRRLMELVKKNNKTSLVINPMDEELNELIKNAQVNILPSFNNTGVKLKLIHALFNGRHCVVNEAAVAGSGLESACHTGTTADAIASIIMQLNHQPFAEEEITLRKKLLPALFDNKENAKKLIQWIW